MHEHEINGTLKKLEYKGKFKCFSVHYYLPIHMNILIIHGSLIF